MTRRVLHAVRRFDAANQSVRAYGSGSWTVRGCCSPARGTGWGSSPARPGWTGGVGTNWIGAEPHVVFPRTAVRIIADGAEPHVCTANDVLVYAADTHYRRELVSAEGDRCLYVAVSSPLAEELGLPLRPRSNPLRHGPCPARRYALAQSIRSAARPCARWTRCGWTKRC